MTNRRPVELVAQIQELEEKVQSWKGAHMVAATDRDILKKLCVRAADALEDSSPLIGAEDAIDKLIAELREAGK